MMKSSLAEEMRPKTWEDYIGIPESIKTLREAISNDSPTAGIMIWGPTGVGKTSLAKLITSSWLCLEREKGTSEPCGQCTVCTGANIDNISYYTPSGNKDSGDGKSSASIVGELISRSKQAPYFMNNKSGVHRQFLFINELQLLSRGTHSSLLEAIEFASNTTTWIFTGMITESNLMDASVMEALSNRCLFIRIPQNSEEDIMNKLLSKFPELPRDTASALSLLSNNNMRQAWSNLALFWPRIPIHEISSELIYEELGGGCSNESRREFWRGLALNDVQLVSNTLNKWLSRCAPSMIVELLIKDMIACPEIFKRESTSIRELCGALRTDLKRSPLHLSFLCYMGLIDLYGDKENEYKDDVLKVDNSKEEDDTKEVEYMRLADALARELSKVLKEGDVLSGKDLRNKVHGVEKEKCALLHLSSIEEIVNYYTL